MQDALAKSTFSSHLAVLWRWKWLFLAITIAVPAIVFAMVRNNPKVYQSSALMGVNSATVDTALISGGGTYSATSIGAVAALVTTQPVAKIAAGLLNPPANPGAIAGQVTASGNETTGFITVSAQDGNPRRAADIANAFVRAISTSQQQGIVAKIDSSIAETTSQLATIGKRDPGVRSSLQGQLAQLQAARKRQTSNDALLNPAEPSYTPISPQVRRDVTLALIVGMMLGLAAVAGVDLVDRRVRTLDELEEMTDLPLLAAIPAGAFGEKLGSGPDSDAPFYMLHTALTRFHDNRLRSIVVTSPAEQDGKTTVASRLAVVAARAGLRVVLVDADLRRAGASAALGLRTETGLADVLAGERRVDEVVLDYEVPGSEDCRVTVVPAGRGRFDPSALAMSPHVQGLLHELESSYDLVIVDSPPALVVSDALALAPNASGVVMVARLNRTRKQTLRQLQRLLTASHATVLGIVATGVVRSFTYDGYFYQYSSHPRDGGKASSRVRRLRHRSEPAQVGATSAGSEVGE